MDDNDFYEDDESIEERRAAWKRGERGTTSGPRDLNQRAQSIVDRAAARWDADEVEVVATVEVDATGWFAPATANAASHQESASVKKTDRLEPVHAGSHS